MARQSEEHELMDRLEADPYDVEVRSLPSPLPFRSIARAELDLFHWLHQSQSKIAEFIRLKAVNQSYEDAMEHSVRSSPFPSSVDSSSFFFFPGLTSLLTRSLDVLYSRRVLLKSPCSTSVSSPFSPVDPSLFFCANGSSLTPHAPSLLPSLP